MTLRSRTLAHLAAGLACLPATGLAQAGALKHDPFTRPAWLKATPPAAAPQRDGAASVPPPEPAWRPELSAVMLAGPRSAVNIDGTIVHLGEVINGHRLVEVHEQAAVFVRNRKKVVLALRAIEVRPGAAPVRQEERPAAAQADSQAKPDAAPKPDAQPKADAPPKPEEK